MKKKGLRKLNLEIFFYKNRDIFYSLGTYILLGAALCLLMPNCSKSKEVKILVPEYIDPSQIPSGNTTPTNGNNKTLGTMNPGEVSALSNFGLVDPVGTSLSQDFDGDAILNSHETLSNYWVAEYPEIDTQIAPPITMKITIEKITGGVSSEIVSDITADDVENRTNEGSEKFHQNELAERTVQYEKAISSSNASSGSTSKSGSGGGGLSIGTFSISGNGSSSSSNSYSLKDSSGLRTSVFENRPFKNNLDRNSASLKSDSAAKLARQYRSEKRTKNTVSTTVKSDAGYVRAALYIENHSVNMPVNLSNILCSLLLETPSGGLVPVQSFRLRNQDYSIFSVNVYGGSQFGPYVIELTGLNTSEIESAIAMGYTPKIYIVDYDMTHVPDSNYRASLSNTFTGNNLKIIEENAKGRTALLKIFAPNVRQMFRIAAFDLNPMPANICDPSQITGSETLIAGSTISQMLKKLKCSGIQSEFDYYIIDFTGSALEPPAPKVFYHGIKSINGISSTIPCSSYMSGTIDDGVNSKSIPNACVIKINNLSQNDIDNMGIWSVFSNGRFYDNAHYMRKKSDGSIMYFSQGIPVIEGIESLVWPGDNFDITYLKLIDLQIKKQNYGKNPLETQAEININTKWKKDDLNGVPYYPNTRSTFLGQAAIGDSAGNLGDQIIIDVKLDDTYFLYPSWGIPVTIFGMDKYSNYSYDRKKDTLSLFNLEEAFDFEINLGLGGRKNDWYSIVNLSETNNNGADGNPVLSDCGRTWDFVSQTFSICVQLPRATSLYPQPADNALLNIYLRSRLNNAYRDSIWPKDNQNVHRFSGKLAFNESINNSELEVINSLGTMQIGNAETGQIIHTGSGTYSVSNVTYDPIVYEVELKDPLLSQTAAGSLISSGSFTGVLKNDTAAGSSILRIIPSNGSLNQGTADSGSFITVSSESHSIGRVDIFQNLYTIGLASPLLENHLLNEEIFIEGTDSQSLNLTAVNFESGWNSLNPERPLLTISADCSNVLPYFYSQADCQGYYNPDYRYSNWLGTGSIDNDWSDASNFNSFLSMPLHHIIPSQFGSMGFVPQENTLVYPMKNKIYYFANSQNPPFDIKTNGQASTLAAANKNIYLKTIDMQNNLKFSGNDFLVNDCTGNLCLEVYTAIFGNLVLIAWSENIAGVANSFDVYGRIFDLSTNQFTGAKFPINTTITTNDQRYLKLAQSGDQVLVTWVSNDGNLNQYNIFGNMVNISTGAVSGDFPISTLNNSSPGKQQIAVSGNNAIVVWDSNGDIRGRIIDLVNGQPIGSGDFLVSQVDAYSQSNPKIAVEGNNALVTWADDSAISQIDIMGRIIDLSTGITGSGFYRFNNAGASTFYDISEDNGNVIIAWTDSTSITQTYYRTFDLNNLSFTNSSETLIGSYGRNISVVLSGNTAQFFWDDLYTIQSNFLDISNQQLRFSQPFPITAKQNTSTSFPFVLKNGSNPIVFWSSDNSATGGTDIYGQITDYNSGIYLPYGLNHFFTAPLIERNYTVKTRLNY